MKRKPILLIIIIGLLSWSIWKLVTYDNGALFKERTHLTVVGFVNMADGLGRQSAELIDALNDQMTINFIPTRKQILEQDVPKKVRDLINKSSTTLGKVIIYEDMLWYPKQEIYKKILKTLKNDAQIRIAYTMIESTLIPSEWVQILNNYFDAVVVPDEFLVSTYLDSGVTIPVFVLPLGLNLDPFLNSPLKSEKNKPMVFGNLSACDDRKNHVALIRAFARAFGNSKDVMLLINSRRGEQSPKKEIHKVIRDLKLNNVFISSICLDKDDYLELFKTIDCYVSLSKSEGFSIQPREAMCLGIPVIATDNSGQSTICKSGLVKTVSSTIKEPSFFFWGESRGCVFNCSVEEASAALLDVYENYSEYLTKGKESREWARQYEFKNLKNRYSTLAMPKQVILGNENKIERDCLMTTSQELYEKYHRLILANY